jgi:hypothetical protein
MDLIKETEIKYFETDVALNWAFDSLRAQQSERKKDADPSPQITVFCKAVDEGEVYTVTLVNADTSQPFIMLMKNVAKVFLNGTKEIQKSLFLSKHEFVTNLTK